MVRGTIGLDREEMKHILFILTLQTILCAEVRETKVTYTDVMLMTEDDIYKAGYAIGIDAAREMRKIEATGLLQETPSVKATSFCSTSANEAYSLDLQFTYKLAEKNNDAIFRDGLEVGCLDQMTGKGITSYRKLIKNNDAPLKATNINAINDLLKKAIPTTTEKQVQRDLEIDELTQAIKKINTLYQ